MELTALRMILAALPVVAMCLVGGVPTASHAQRIVSFPSATGYETISRDRGRERFPRKEELLQALDFLESYERGARKNDWNRDQDLGGGLLYKDEDVEDAPYLGDTNKIYPGDLDLDFRQDTEGYPENLPLDDDTLDLPPWLVSYLLREAQGKQENYPPQEEDPESLLLNLDDEELLEVFLKEEEEEEIEEAIEEVYREEMEREEEEALAEIVEQEIEEEAVQDILDDIWAQEMLQEDAEENLKWLLVEEEEKLQREEEQAEEDPFEFEFSSEAYPADEYSMVDGPEEVADLVGDSLDEAEKEELMEEAAEIFHLQDMEDEEEDRRNDIRASRILEGLISSLTKQAIQDELLEEGEAAEDEEESEDEGEFLTSSELDAGMGDTGSEEDVQQEVYNELEEFLQNEIDQAIEDVAGDIIEAIKEEAEEEAGGLIDEEVEEVTDEEQDSQEVTSEGSEDEEDQCSSLQYFIDDCNIVNNYGDLGADGYKELFAGSCNRHQLCYACGGYYDIGTKLCDELYKAEMLARCDADDLECRQRAKYFWLVARNNRIPAYESSPSCADPCILKYMVEV